MPPRRSFRLQAGPQRLERDVDSELQFHLAMRAEKLAARGLPLDAAEAEALRQFGDLGAVRAECVTIDREREKTMKRLMRLDDLRQDAAFALRSLRKRPGFTAIVLAILALGIGANTAMFSLVDALLLRALPVPHPEQLVTIGDPARPGAMSFGPPRVEQASWPLFKDVRDGSRHILSGIYATGTTPRLDVLVERGPDGGALPGAEPEHPRGRFVSGAFWKTLGVQPVRGRAFGEETDEGSGAIPVAVVSHGWWTRRLGADPAIVGRTITVNDVPLTIIGVAPEGFTGDIVGSRIDLWMPITLQPMLTPDRPILDQRGASWILMMGRLAPGVSLARAQAELAALEVRSLMANATGDDLTGVKAMLENFPPHVASGATGFSGYRRTYGAALVTLSAAVVLVLLVVCANVANLMLARATARGREMSVRLAIGASRGRLMQQLLVESLLLGLAGGALGIAVGWWGSAALLRLASSGPNPIPLTVRVDGRVLAFTAALSAGTALLFGLAPAFHATRVQLATALRGAAGAVTGGPRGRLLLGRALVVAQVGLSLLLLVSTAMLVRSMQRIDRADLGIARDQLVIAEIDASRSGYGKEKVAALMNLLMERARNTPGVTGATVSQNGIFSGTQSNTTLQVEGFVARRDADTLVNFDVVGPGYVRATGARLLRGREIGPGDQGTSEKVAMVNESFARFFFRDGEALDRHVTFDSASYRIVGVIGDVQGEDVRGERSPRIYFATFQGRTENLPGQFKLLLRTTADPATMVEPIRRSLIAAVPSLNIGSLDALPALVRDTVTQDRLVARVVAAFGILTLVLASLGLYGVMAYATARREREFGLRMALGATSGIVVRLVLRDALVLLVAGIAVGLPATLAAVRMIRGQLFGVELIDPPSILIAIAVLGTSIALAGWLPARRAAGVQPDVALRAE